MANVKYPLRAHTLHNLSLTSNRSITCAFQEDNLPSPLHTMRVSRLRDGKFFSYTLVWMILLWQILANIHFPKIKIRCIWFFEGLTARRLSALNPPESSWILRSRKTEKSCLSSKLMSSVLGWRTPSPRELPLLGYAAIIFCSFQV